MARLFILLLCFCAFQVAYCQDTDLHVVSSAGDSYQSDGLILDWTLGEPVVSTYEKSSLIVSQGFHQPEYTIVSVNPLSIEIGSVNIFPNPFLSAVSIKASFIEYESGRFELYDMSGHKIWTKSFEGTDLLESFPATALSSGSYMLVLKISGKAKAHTYKLLKTE